ncbi:MAG: sensor histidine kinase, partial [Actinomycetota bacterium]|nr:sensor histidine kinase [Actinomycetota bacterium]
NALRHAAGASARVNLCYDTARLSLAVRNGAGAGASSNGTTPGMGIAGMRERACAIGGSLRAGPIQEEFRVQAELPYNLRQ